MAATLLLSSCLVCSLIYLTNSTPLNITLKDDAAAINPETIIEEPQTVEDSHFVTSSSGVSSRRSVEGGHDVDQKTFFRTMNIVQKGHYSQENVKNDAVDTPVVKDTNNADIKSNVMTLTDDVITDALFSNIDTLQDHLEVCEEGLRQKLRLHSHRRLQDAESDAVDYRGGEENYKMDRAGSSDSKKDSRINTVDEGYDDNDSSDEEGDDNSNDEADNEDDDDGQSSEVASDSSSKITDRKRRFVTGVNHGGQLSQKVDVLAQKIVQRLSARLDYLRSSVLQCHLLYKRLETL